MSVSVCVCVCVCVCGCVVSHLLSLSLCETHGDALGPKPLYHGTCPYREKMEGGWRGGTEKDRERERDREREKV